MKQFLPNVVVLVKQVQQILDIYLIVYRNISKMGEKIQKEWFAISYRDSPYLLDQWKPYTPDDLDFQKKEWEDWSKLFESGEENHTPILIHGPPGSGKHCKLELWMKVAQPKKHGMYERWRITEKKDTTHSPIWYEQTIWGAREYKWIEAGSNEKEIYQHIHQWVSDQSISEKKWVILPFVERFSESVQRALGLLIEKTQKYVRWILMSHSIQKCSVPLKSRCLIFHTREPKLEECEKWLGKDWRGTKLGEWIEMRTMSIPRIGKISYYLECFPVMDKIPYEFFLLQEAKKYWLHPIVIPCKEETLQTIRGICHGLFHLEITIDRWYEWLIEEGKKEWKEEWVMYLEGEYNSCKNVFRELFVYEMSWVQCQNWLNKVEESGM